MAVGFRQVKLPGTGLGLHHLAGTTGISNSEQRPLLGKGRDHAGLLIENVETGAP